MNDVSKTFCILPWTHLATLTDGSVLLCCVAENDLRLNLNDTNLKEAWNSQAFRQARQKMLAGEPVPSCHRCYREERSGYRSHRVTENWIWESRFSRELLQSRITSTDSAGYLDHQPMSIDLRLGNTCNLTCVMCRPQDSSKWSALAKNVSESVQDAELKSEWEYKSQIQRDRFEWYQNPRFWEDVEDSLPYLREIIIGGGEPLLLEEHLRLVEACVESGHASHIQLRYHSNGTILADKLFDLWRHFQLVEFFVSLDGIGERNTYLRFPASWSSIEANLQKIDGYPHENLRCMILCSVHFMNMFYLDEFGEWLQQQNFRLITHGFNGYYHPAVVHHPEYLSIQTYPKELKETVAARIRRFEAKSSRRSNKLEGVIGFMNQSDQSRRLPQTRQYIAVLDQHRKTSFTQTFPELCEALGWRSHGV